MSYEYKFCIYYVFHIDVMETSLVSLEIKQIISFTVMSVNRYLYASYKAGRSDTLSENDHFEILYVS